MQVSGHLPPSLSETERCPLGVLLGHSILKFLSGLKAEGRRASPGRPPARRFGKAGCRSQRFCGFGRDKVPLTNRWITAPRPADARLLQFPLRPALPTLRLSSMQPIAIAGQTANLLPGGEY